MKLKLLFIICFLFFGFIASAQDETNLETVNDSLSIEQSNFPLDSLEISFKKETLYNSVAINKFFNVLRELDSAKTRKVNIVHIGDSHIQADLMTGKLRSSFQNDFGNSGLGFVFPYSLANTNGSSGVKFTSNIEWNSQRNIYPNIGNPVGLSGIALFKEHKSPIIGIKVRKPENAFNYVKIITPNNASLFKIGKFNEGKITKTETSNQITHKIKSGQTLSGIANKYNVSVSQIKKLNNLKNNNIRAGKTLKISEKTKISNSYKFTEFTEFENSITTEKYYNKFYNTEPLQEVHFVSKDSLTQYSLNGIVLENNNPGVLYHAIGVNGAKHSDYNKYPMFFEQINALHPDLIVISLGTNEAFDKQNNDIFFSQVEIFLNEIRKQNPEVSILVTTPPPSLFNRKNPNTFSQSYAKVLVENSEKFNYSTFDMHNALGGNANISNLSKLGLIAKDRVHYTSNGYQEQGILLYQSIIDAYNNYLKTN